MSDNDPRERVEYDPKERVPAKSDEATVREYLEGISGSDISVLDRLAGDERLKQVDATLRSAFPDYRIEPNGMTSRNGEVFVTFTLHGTHLREFRGIAPTERTVSVPGSARFRVEAGRIADASFDTNDEEILRQIGGPTASTPA